MDVGACLWRRRAPPEIVNRLTISGAILQLVLTSALAETPLPSYEDQVIREKWYEVNELLEAGLPAEAEAKATAFQEQVTPDGGLEYLVGLSWRIRDDGAAAEKHYRRALELNPNLQEAWSDLGELLLIRGELQESEKCYREVSRLVPAGRFGWLGPQRLAEIAAHRHDPEEFDVWMHEALRRGFSIYSIAGLPNWQGFYADPAMHDTVAKFVTVYGDEDLRRSLERPVPIPKE